MSAGRAILVLWGALSLGGLALPLSAQDVAEDAPAVQEAKPAETAPAKAEDKAAEKKVEAAKEADQKEMPPKPAVPKNPLQNLFRGIFGGGKPQGRIIPRNPQNANPPGDVKDPANGDNAARDRIDARAPYDPNVAKLLRRAEAHVEAARAGGKDEEWKQALDILNYVLDPSPPGAGNQPVEDALIRRPDGKWSTMRQEANRLLAKFPPAQLEAYRQQFGGLAERLFADAQKQADVEQIATVATQFFHTLAGSQAANWMGLRHFDHGEFGLAARWFRQLLDNEAELTRSPQWQLKAAIAFHHAGDAAASEKLLEQLSARHGTLFRIADQPVRPEEWLAKLDPAAHAQAPALDDWPTLYGSASRVGTARGGDPLLLSRWSQPLTNSQSAIDSIQTLVDDLNDVPRGTVPAFFPILVDGKVIFRTLRGVRVTDAATGEMLWETRAGLAPESLLTGLQTSQPQYAEQQMGFIGGDTAQFYNGGSPEYHALTNLLFRDGTWGAIASDGEQLFVLEDQGVLLPYQPGNHWAFQNGNSDPHQRDLSTNKIVAYNLATGRPRWEIGGTAMDEPFDRRLAGQYFFGVPVADQEELFTIGERDNEIRLFALDRETGRPKWSQLVAYSDAKIEQDFGRRWWNAQVGVGEGVLVCPTTVGWLVGIDRLNRTVLWAYRYTAPGTQEQQPHREQNNQVPQSPLNQQWGTSAPIIVGHRVVYTPPEADVMVCLDLFSGEKLWSKQKDDNLYLAGVFDGRAVLVGLSSLSAVSLESGSTEWTLPLSEGDGKPCGMGVAIKNQYYLPLSSGQLWSVDLSKGQVTSKAYLPDGLPQLGNLGAYRGLLVSLGPSGLTAFAQRQAIEQEILAHRQADPQDAWATLYEAQIQLLGREFEPALKLLRQVRPEKLNAADQSRYRAAMLETLTTVIRGDFKHRETEYHELAAFVKTDDEQLTFRRLTAERLHARGDYQAAFDEYLSLADTAGQRQITRDDDPTIRLSLERWLSGRLELLWQDVSGDDRARLDERIAAAADAAKAQVTDQAQRFLLLFGFHPEAIAVRMALVEERALTGEVARAQNQLLKLSRHPDEQIAAAALERLAKLFRDRGLPRDANYYDELLAYKYPNVQLDGQTPRAVKTVGSAAHVPIAWSDAKIDELRTGTNYSSGNQEHDLQYTPYRLPFFQDHRFTFYQSDQRLAVANAADDSIDWLVPLRTAATSSQGNLMPSDTAGHVLFVVHSGVLHALSPIDRQILWTQPLDPKVSGNTYYSSNAHVPQPMHLNNSSRTAQTLFQQRQGQGSLVVVNSDYVAVLGRRSFSIHDTVTGRLRWSKHRLPNNARLYGTDDLVFVSPPETSKAVALSAIDGRPVEVPNLATLLVNAVRVLPEGLVVLESKSARSILGLSRGTSVVRLVDPRTNRDYWTAEYPSGTYFSLMDDNYLAAVKPSGQLELLDLETGRARTMEGVSEEDLKSKSELRVLSDHDNLYLIVNQRTTNRSYYYYGGNMGNVTVNGQMFAWNRNTGRFLWKEKLLGKQLLLMHFTHSPLLVFSTRNYQRAVNIGYYATTTLALDKHVGQTKVELSAPTSYSGFQTMSLNLGQRNLEFRTYNLRLRLTALPPDTEEESPATAEKPSREPPIAPPSE